MATHAVKKSIAYPNDGFRAKDHWRFHLGDQLVRDGLIWDCFPGERVNRAFKQCAQEIMPTTDTTDLGFEASVMKRIMVHFDDMWSRGGFRNQLLRPMYSEDLERATGLKAFVSNAMMYNGTEITRDDMLLIDGVPQHIAGCASVDGALALLALKLSFVRQEITTRCATRGGVRVDPIPQPQPEQVPPHQSRYLR